MWHLLEFSNHSLVAYSFISNVRTHARPSSKCNTRTVSPLTAFSQSLKLLEIRFLHSARYTLSVRVRWQWAPTIPCNVCRRRLYTVPCDTHNYLIALLGLTGYWSRLILIGASGWKRPCAKNRTSQVLLRESCRCAHTRVTAKKNVLTMDNENVWETTDNGFAGPAAIARCIFCARSVLFSSAFASDVRKICAAATTTTPTSSKTTTIRHEGKIVHLAD